MKRLTFAVLGAFCLTVMAAGITFATTDQQEIDDAKDVVALENEQAVLQEDAASQDLITDEEACQKRKKMHKEMRDTVDRAEKERCQ